MVFDFSKNRVAIFAHEQTAPEIRTLIAAAITECNYDHHHPHEPKSSGSPWFLFSVPDKNL